MLRKLNYNAARGKQKRKKQKQRFGAADRVVVLDGGTVGWKERTDGRVRTEQKLSKATNRRKAKGKHRKSRHYS